MATNFNLRLDEDLKAESFSIIESFGMTPSQFMRLVLKQVADTGSLPLTFEGQDANTLTPNETDYTLSENGERLVKESIQAFENGDYSSYSSLDELNQAIAEIANG